jgi:hypothetical protein
VVIRKGYVRVALGWVLLAGSFAAGSAAMAPVVEGAPAHPLAPWAGPNEGFGTQTSLNWAGYAVTGGTFSKAVGSWTQPHATCPSPSATQRAAFWIGIDGFAKTDPTVQQVGTDSDCVKGTPTYYAWFQMFPKAATFLPTSKYPVAPGEAISAQVSGSGKNFTLVIMAVSGGVTKWRFSTNQTASKVPKDSSAELITEAPCIGSPCQIVPLSNFGTINFSGASANGRVLSTASGFKVTKLTMTTKGGATIKARTSSLSPGGTSFSVTWAHT